MNKRIKELAELVYGSAHYDDFKFADLLVRECCDIINSQVQHNNPNDCVLVLKIKEHFGVE